MSVFFNEPARLLSIDGIRLATINANLYANERDDLSIIEIVEGSNCSIVFTQNQFCAAPVIVSKRHIKKTSPQYIIINAANANAGTGDIGIKDAIEICRALAQLTKCNLEQVLTYSTGVIGEYLPVRKIVRKIDDLLLGLAKENWLAVSKAIMTTDKVAKGISKTINIEGKIIAITGIAKGSGMIKPNMATMLSFIATDINISKELLDKALKKAVNNSFNKITIDGDTSTNDACTLIATASAKNIKIEDVNDEGFKTFYRALFDICCYLAHVIVKDGEGATKFVKIQVLNGLNSIDCLSVAYKIAESPLVKTALTASDPNWGRILAAIGNSKVNNLNINKVSIFLDDVCIVNKGEKDIAYNELVGREKFLKDEINIIVDLGMGNFQETVWTSDLSHEYIKINSEYRS